MSTPPTEPHVQPHEQAPTCYRHPDRETYIVCQRCGRPICPDCMREAAVGFQCPSCVADGAKQTRQGRTTYGGQVVSNTGLVSMVLIGLNAAVWLLIAATGFGRSRLTDYLALHRDGICFLPDLAHYQPGVGAATCRGLGDLWYAGFSDGAAWQALTATFTHVEIWHIAMNMYALYVLGPTLEALLGRWRFLALYLLSGLAGSAAVVWLSDPARSTLGASGAIFGLMAAMFLVVLKHRGNVSAIGQVLVINLVITVVGSSFISWQGHLGGFLGGLAAGAALVYAPVALRTRWQLLGLTAVGIVVLGLLAAALVA